MNEDPFTLEVHMDLDAKKNKFTLKFDYHPDLIHKVKALPSSLFVPVDKGGPHWTVPATLDVARAARSALGDGLVLSKAVKRWGKAQVTDERNLTTILSAESHELEVIPENFPHLMDSLKLGPAGRFMTDEEKQEALASGEDSYQVADVAFMSYCNNPLNASEMGTGKTLETLGSIVESQIPGPHLIVAPLSSLTTVWRKEVAMWTPGFSTIVVTGDANQKARAISKAQKMIKRNGEKLIVITNPATIRLKGIYEMVYDKEKGKTKRVEVDTEPENPFFQETKWGAFVLDEFHKMGMTNNTTLMSRGARKVMCEKKIALSGTPMGGKPLRLFGILQWLEPDLFTSKWAFAENYLSIELSSSGYRQIGDVRPERRDDFNKMLSRYMVRRTKREVLPWLPEIQRIEVDVPMTTKQAKQYHQFAAEAEVRIDDHKLTATGVLAEYTRLKQFANALCTVRVEDEWDEEIEEFIPKIYPTPTEESNKLAKLLELIEELGIDEDDSEEQIVIFSQFVDMVDMVARVLNDKGIPTGNITGKVKGEDRTDQQEEFQAEGGLRAIVMNTLAGGVSITLDRASTVVFLDETWDPDDQSQGEARCHRASRIHQVTAYYFRSEDTVEAHIRDVTQSKQFVNFNILDARQEGLRA